MTIRPRKSVLTCISFLCMVASGPSLSQESIGTVTQADSISHIEREASTKRTDKQKDELTGHPIEIGDKLESHADELGAQLQILFTPEGGRETDITMEKATLKFSQEEGDLDGGLMCQVTGKVLYSRGRRVKDHRGRPGGEGKCEAMFAGRTAYRAHGTRYLLDARGMETSLFVMDGSVEVSRSNPDPSEKQMVYAGEWLLVRDDEPIPSPKRFRRFDVSGGSSQCIYSDCKINDKVPIPQPPDPGILLPPPPNPPGLRR